VSGRPHRDTREGGGRSRGSRREGKGEGEREEGELTLVSKNQRKSSLDHLGQRGGRERWKKGRGSCCAGKSNEREIERGHMGVWGAKGARVARRAGPGWVGLGRELGRKPTTHTRPLIGNQMRIEIRNEVRRTRD
jgi:hypothetical protein